MNDNEKKFEQYLEGIDFDDAPDNAHRDLLENKLRLNFTASSSRPNIKWSMFMRTRMTKISSAAAVVVISLLGVFFLSTPASVALADIMEAMHSVRYLHVKLSEADSQVAKEAWVEFDGIGNLQNLRLNIESQTGPEDERSKVITWRESKAKVWIVKKDILVTIFDKEMADQILDMVTKLDPKNAIANMLEGQEEGDLVLDIQEPSNKIDPIIIEVEVLSEEKFLVLSIDQATKLLKSFKLYLLEDGEYKYDRTIEYHDYNQPIDPAMFVLEDEVPEDVMVIDQTIVAVGLKKGSLTDEQIAVKLAREFFEAMIAKDYAKAGALYSGVPAEKMHQVYGKMNIVEIVSIGEPTVHLVNRSLKVPCVLMITQDGQNKEFSPDGLYVRQMHGQPGRWEIIGGM